MERKNRLYETIADLPLRYGAFKAAVIKADKVETDPAFRAMCQANACGMFGKCYMCPPDVGEIDKLMAEVKNYEYALVYQTVSALEDSYDYEGMTEAKRKSYPLAQNLRKAFSELGISHALHLGAGACGTCERCAKATGEPCRAPTLALPSLEAYGINVSRLAATAGMKYINGQNTVTYFGAVLFSLKGDVL